jgi:hypothetical protein
VVKAIEHYLEEKNPKKINYFDIAEEKLKKVLKK